MNSSPLIVWVMICYSSNKQSTYYHTYVSLFFRNWRIDCPSPKALKFLGRLKTQWNKISWTSFISKIFENLDLLNYANSKIHYYNNDLAKSKLFWQDLIQFWILRKRRAFSHQRLVWIDSYIMDKLFMVIVFLIIFYSWQVERLGQNIASGNIKRLSN